MLRRMPRRSMSLRVEVARGVVRSEGMTAVRGEVSGVFGGCWGGGEGLVYVQSQDHLLNDTAAMVNKDVVDLSSFVVSS